MRNNNNRRTVHTRKRAKKKKLNYKIVLFALAALLIVLLAFSAVIAFKSDESISIIEKEEVEKTEENDSKIENSNNQSDRNQATDEKETYDKTSANIDEIVSGMSLEEKVNQLFFITPEALTNVDCVVAAGEQTKSALEKHPVGGIIYFGQNITSEKQTKEMLKNIKKYAAEVCKAPLFLGIDEEGGTVARLGNSPNVNVPSVSNMSDIGKSGDIKKAYDAGSTIGKYLEKYGFNMDFAPVADVLTNDQNTVVKDRSFGSDAKLVSEMALQVSKGLNDEGIYSCFKHFPGHGATKDDTHEGFAFNNKTYDELAQCELIPFIDAINSGADFIMVGHFSLPNVTNDNTPASISSVIINDILKERLGYKGIVITDSLSMQALTDLYGPETVAVKAVNAGVDMLLMPQNFEQAYNAVLSAVKSGEISEERINESVRKIISVKMEKMQLEF